MSRSATKQIEKLTADLRRATRNAQKAEVANGYRHPSCAKARASMKRIENAILRLSMKTPTKNDITSVDLS